MVSTSFIALVAALLVASTSAFFAAPASMAYMTRTSLKAEQSSGVQDFKKDVREAFSEAGE
jgi:hypothetical protein